MTDQTYNGWHNRATWLVNLHLSNDQGTHEYAQEIVAQAIDGAPDYPSHYAGEALRTWVESMTSEAEGMSLLASDMLGQVISDVDWITIAEHYMEALAEAEQYA